GRGAPETRSRPVSEIDIDDLTTTPRLEAPVRSKARKVAGKVQATIDTAADRVAAGVHKAADRTVALSEGAAGRAQQVADVVEPFVRTRPFASTGLALGLGVVIGLLLAGRGPKVIYVKPRY